MTFGLALENALDSCEGKTSREIDRKRKSVFMRWLGVEDEQRFRNPPQM